MFLTICLELTECFFLPFHFSNPSHPFVAGLTLEKLSAVTVDDSGKKTFVSGCALGRIQKVQPSFRKLSNFNFSLFQSLLMERSLTRSL